MHPRVGKLLIALCLAVAIETNCAAATELHVGAAAVPQVSRMLELVVVTDYEMFLRYGADTRAVVRERVNRADEIFRRDLGVGLHLARIVVFETPDDPFEAPEGVDAIQTLASELQAYRSQIVQFPSRADLVHLFTAREVLLVAGNSAGGVCSHAASVSYFTTDAPRYFEHELGHDLGARHDVGSSCGDDDYIMSGGGNGDSFSPCSKAAIAATLAQTSCQFEEDLPWCQSNADGDGDGLCDTLDLCTSETTLLDVKLKVNAYRSMEFSATANAGAASVDPAVEGLRVILQTAAGGEVFDVTVPGGAYDAATRRGWTVSGNGNRRTFVSKKTAVGGIVSKVILRSVPGAPGWFKFSVQGIGAEFHPSVAGGEPRATLMFGHELTRCADASFPSYTCRSASSGRSLVCRS